MDTCPTVKIRSPNQGSGYLIINESDFDPVSMVLYDGDKHEENHNDEWQAGTASVGVGEGTAKSRRKSKKEG